MNEDARCTEPPSQSNARGAQNTPRRAGPSYRAPVVGSYDRGTGKLKYTDTNPSGDVTYTGGAAALDGRRFLEVAAHAAAGRAGVTPLTDRRTPAETGAPRRPPGRRATDASGSSPGLRRAVGGLPGPGAPCSPSSPLVVEVATLRAEVRSRCRPTGTPGPTWCGPPSGSRYQVNNYDVASVDDYQAGITPLLSPKFKGEFDKAMADIVTSVKQAKMTSKGEVLSSAVSSLDPDSALVAGRLRRQRQAVLRHPRPAFRWEVSLVRSTAPGSSTTSPR